MSLWVWRQYLATDDHQFLIDNYPIMAASARFLLSYQKLGSGGLLHTSPSNAHETQWDVTDPTTDIAAAKALYPAAIAAAELLGKDAKLVRQLQEALPKMPPAVPYVNHTSGPRQPRQWQPCFHTRRQGRLATMPCSWIFVACASPSLRSKRPLAPIGLYLDQVFNRFGPLTYGLPRS